MAVAHVAGIAALLNARGYTAAGAAQRIISTAKDLGSNGWDAQTGYGRVDALSAVGASSGPAPAPAPKPAAKKAVPKKKVTAAASPAPAPSVKDTKITPPSPSSSPRGILLAADDLPGTPPAPRRTLVTIAAALSLLVGVAHPFARVTLRRR